MNRYFVGFDPAQASDWSAVCVAEEMEDKQLYVRHLERWRGVSYVDQVEKIVKLMTSPALRYRATLILDGTGVGAPIVDMFKELNLRPMKVVKIHGGDAEHRDPDDALTYRVPKRDLIGGVQAALQSEKLKIAKGLEHAETLKRELLNFRVKVNLRTTHESFEAWREGDHDDLLLACALAAWGARKTKPTVVPTGPTQTSYWRSYGKTLQNH